MAHGITFDMWERRMAETRGEAAYGASKFHLDVLAKVHGKTFWCRKHTVVA